MDDEINLRDALRNLYKYSWVFLIVVPLSLIIGYFYYDYHSKIYVYRTPIEIGVFINQNGYNLIESVDTASKKLNEIYIQGNYATATEPSGNLIVLKSKGLLTEEENIRKLHLQISNSLIKDHDRFVVNNDKVITKTRVLLTKKFHSLQNSIFLILLNAAFLGIISSVAIILSIIFIAKARLIL